MGKFIGCGETGRCWWVSVWSSWLKMVQRHPSGNVHGLLGNLSLIIKIKVSLRAMVVKLNCQTRRAHMEEVMTWEKSKIEEISFKNILIKYLAGGGERYNVGGGVIQSSQWLKSKEHEWIQEDEDEWNRFPTKGNKLESPQILALSFFQQRSDWVHKGHRYICF